MKWFVYVLKSDVDNKRYLGSTNNLERRLKEHNSGKVFSTKNRKPFRIIYTEEYLVEKDARLRERFLKSHKGFNFLNKVINAGSSSDG